MIDLLERTSRWRGRRSSFPDAKEAPQAFDRPQQRARKTVGYGGPGEGWARPGSGNHQQHGLLVAAEPLTAAAFGFEWAAKAMFGQLEHAGDSDRRLWLKAEALPEPDEGG